MDIALASIIISIIFAVTGIVVALICVEKPRNNKQKIDSLKQELLIVYHDLLSLKQVEEELESKAGISKIAARKSVTISPLSETQKIKKRIQELEQQ